MDRNGYILERSLGNTMQTIQKYVEEAMFVANGQGDFTSTIKHGLNTIDALVQLYSPSNQQVLAGIEIVDANTVKLYKKDSEKVRVVIIG